jgi:DNA recombination protein RmuC
MELVYLGVGVALGALLVYLFNRFLTSAERTVSERQISDLKTEIERLRIEVAEKERSLLELSGLASARDTEIVNLRQRLAEEREGIEKMQERMKIDFKVLAGELLEEKSKKFTEQNRENLDELLKPFSENLKDFRRKVEETHMEGEKSRFSLFNKIKDLEELNRRISDEATALTRALKGESKTRGNWGEMILESILEKSGLQKEREYFVQSSFTTEDGRRLQPDIVVRYPGDRNIVIDSKVSLIAYEEYYSTDDQTERERFLRAHLLAVRNHINELAAKDYQGLYKINTLDFVMMFMPVEPSYVLALQADQGIWSYAYDRRILLISPTNLIAALKMIESMWRQEYQNRNVLEIATQGGALYDDFVMLAERLVKLGKKLDEARDQYDETFKKLSTGKGNLISRVSKLKLLGVKAKKSLPGELQADGVDEES